MNKILPVMAVLAFSMAACVGEAADDNDDTSNASDDNSANLTGALSLGNCTTTIGAGVPAFFKTYFKCANISVSGTNVVITTKGLPPHLSYYYGTGNANYTPFDYSRTGYAPNKNKIGQQNVTITIPVNPTAKGARIDSSTVNGVVNGPVSGEYKLGSVGVALDSVLMYNPLAAPGDVISTEAKTFDSYNAHPDGSSVYHYHTTSPGPLEVLSKLGLVTSTTPGKAQVELYGMMCDGTVVLGCKELDGGAPSTSTLDAQNGHVHDIKDKTKAVLLANRYHTHICSSFTGTPNKNMGYTPEIQYYNTCSVTSK